ncbi:hypothetical protein ABRQ21_07025 [Latilactobacillus sakei]|uniref:hypothetical protein n=1 Tax=Latilactobacillus sakei TaxID=1599 RepID=UPI0020C7D750|nr:hypothetical protein [Latilactobacillus sakei]MCP8851497.1 hypothetical protein [Latilactobacillus sakei]
MFTELMVHDYERLEEGYETEFIKLFEPYRCIVNINNICYLSDVSEQVKDDGKFYQLRMNNDVSLVIEGRELVKLVRQ